MALYPHEFEGGIVHDSLGSYRYMVVFLAEPLAAELPFAGRPRLRFSSEIADIPFEGAWQRVRGRHDAMLGKPLLKAAGLRRLVPRRR
jgi:hypothetical protein